MRAFRTFTIVILAGCACRTAHAGDPELTLWSGQPAGNWEAHALPLGNGPMGWSPEYQMI